MTVGQGKEFYGPLRTIFVEKLKTPLAKRIGEDEKVINAIASHHGDPAIVEYLTKYGASAGAGTAFDGHTDHKH